MFAKFKRWWRSGRDGPALDQRLDVLRERTPVPLFWLFGKTQSGKTSVIKYLTGAGDAEIGEGFRPCTRTSRLYQFPTAEAPLVSFLDTRGLDEPGYDAAEDLARFGADAHLVLVTIRLLDHAHENLIAQLRKIRAAQPARPVVLAVTCLHELYPQQQHSPYEGNWDDGPRIGDEPSSPIPQTPSQSSSVNRLLVEHHRRFDGLADAVVPIDFTKPAEGFNEPNYGGARLTQVLLEHLPAAYRQTLRTLDQLRKRHAERALPVILGYSALAATAAAVPVPWIDLLILPSIKSRMIAHLAERSGRPLDGTRFAELAASMGLGLFARQAIRELAKFIPYVGSVAAAALAAGSTYAMGQAYLYYERSVHQGHVPSADELRDVYREQLKSAKESWGKRAV